MQRHFDEQDVQRVNTAIGEVEEITSAEIVCVAAASSGRYDRAEDIFGLLLGMIAAGLVWIFLPDAVPGGDTWAGYTPTTKIAFMALAVLGGFVLGTVWASHAWPLRRPFVPKSEQRENVSHAASAAFFDQSLHHTRAGTGLLIYLSMDERRAVILADEAVLEALSQTTLDTLCRDLTKLLAETDAAEALCQTIRRAGQHLEALPRDEDDTNEHPNTLVLID
ncbi:TPM domain-containing protein [Algisphaera agarilytica]|nr:hypothetical protein [Algisphaera agarilytica]